ncbi:MAG: YhcH/YjgK/YiaL family protein [Lachnospiraceae bacterium]|nr:YhcH/YjgK/YiaL family protein [Lachnospiraceae bacterium]
MIITDLDNVDFYSSILGKNAEKAIKALKETPFLSLNEGRYDVDGDEVYFMVNKYNTKSPDVAQFETHKKYVDIQYMVKGNEIIYCDLACHMEICGEYNLEKDKQRYVNAPGTIVIRMHPGNMVLLFPEDAHKVGCMIGNNSHPVFKVVLKVKI